MGTVLGHRLWLSLLLLCSLSSLGNGGVPAAPAQGSVFLSFGAPAPGLLGPPGSVAVELRLFALLVDPETVVVELDGVPLAPEIFAPVPGGLAGELTGLGPGVHRLEASAERRFPRRGPRARRLVHAATHFEMAPLPRPDDCELLHSAHCLLPWPSSRFQVDDPSTRTGLRLQLPFYVVPGLRGPPILTGPLNFLDGYSPTAQVLMNFPQGVDLAASGAPVLLAPGCCGQSSATPYVGVRTMDERSLERDSPTVLIDAETGERVAHWVELDGRTTDPARQILFLRPAVSLLPGHRYIVAVRHLIDANGAPVEPEPAFRALRDGAPSLFPQLEARREHSEEVFRSLRRAGIRRRHLVAAFDFTVRSAGQLAERMLAMREDALGWVDGLAPDDASSVQIGTVTDFGDCSDPGQRVWRRVAGRFRGPFYLTATLDSHFTLPFLNVDALNMPVRNGLHPFDFDLAVPCTVFRGEAVGHPLLLGHGLFQRGSQMIDGFVSGSFGVGDVDYIAGAGNWRGLSELDLLWLLFNIIGTNQHRLNNFPALPHRLKQGQVNALVLARLMKSGFFNRLPQFQRVPGDPTTGVFPGPDTEMFYFGVSLGGIMGGFHAAVSQDIERFNLDVPGMNFSLLLQRSTQFAVFETLLESLGLTDAMELAMALGLLHEAWVSAEPAAYVRNITGEVDPPLADTPAKRVLMTVAWLDKQVSNQATEIMARSMGLPSLVGSLQAELADIPDRDAGADGLDSALVIYDSGYFDVFDPAFDGVVPPLSNLIPSPVCDPHGTARLSIPASQEQLAAFLQPGGTIFNFCDGACDASSDFERPAAPCNPL